jgi:hypothetical protein
VVADALTQLAEQRNAVQVLLARITTRSGGVGVVVADRREDAAVTALHDLLVAWARVADELAVGKMAEHLYERMFGHGGLGFLQLPVQREWEAVEEMLQRVKKERLRPSLAKLGAVPLLDYLITVHTDYGEAVGMTRRVTTTGDPPELRERHYKLLEAIHGYVTQVHESVDRGKPATRLLADRLLRPLAHRGEARRP